MKNSTDINTNLDALEAEAIYIIREVAAECENPVMLYSIGKDSSVMLHLAMKAFFPEKPPFPFMHIDTTWKFKEMIEFRDKIVDKYGIDMIVYKNEEGIKHGINPFEHGAAYTDIMKTQALKQAISKYGFTAAFGGGRRDEEKSRAKERIFSFRNREQAWNPKNQRPEMWNEYNTRINQGESIRVFPISNWTEKDIWQYIEREKIDIVPLYFAKERPIVYRDGNIIMVDDNRMPIREGEEIVFKKIRFRTLGCYPLTGGLESNASTLREIIAETLGAVSSERTSKSTVLWMDDTELMEGKSFLLKLGTKLVPATVLSVDYRIDVNTGEQIVSDKLNKNEIAVCKIGVTEKIVLDEFEKHRSLGHFILIDRITNMTAACGVVNHVMRRTDDLFWQEMDVTRNVRANMKNQTPLTLWFTGLSGAGKSTIANEIEKRLVIAGKHTMCLDGDNVRLGLNKDLGFVEKDRGESIRRIAEVAKLFNDAGLIVITSCISPYELDRDTARKIIGNSNFVEVYVSTPLSQCEKRDVKGLYKKARKGQILNFTGVNSIYEMPSNAEIVVDTTYMGVEETADYVMSKLDEYLSLKY